MTTPNPDLITATAHALQAAAVDCVEDHPNCERIEGHLIYRGAAWIDGKWSDDIDRIEGSTLDIARTALTAAATAGDSPEHALLSAVIKQLRDQIGQITTYATNLTEIAPYKTDVGGIGEELLDIIRKGQP